jgi:hypothetical protein
MALYSPLIATALRDVLRNASPCVRRRHHARATCFQAELWAGRIAEHLGANSAELALIRRATKVLAYARWTRSRVPTWARVPKGWQAVSDVAIAFTEMISPFESDPTLPTGSVRALLESPDLAVREAACALAEYFGLPVDREWVAGVRCEDIEAVRAALRNLGERKNFGEAV